MDARERLRRYLEQRRELGESELVLDGMSVDDVLRVVGAANLRGGAAGTSAAPRRPEAHEPAPEWGMVAPDSEPAAEPPREVGAPADWRETLRAAGAGEPTGDQPHREQPSGDQPRGDEPGAGMAPSPAPGAASAPDATTGERVIARPAAKAPVAGSARQLIEGLGVPLGLAVGEDRAQLFGGPFDHLDSLDAVAKTVAGCTRCPLYKTANRAVPGEGNPDADLVVVGEAPGADEDATGRPFVGAAGQLLTRILAAIDLRREDVFICNVLKHRPPGNRNPAPDEVEACSPYLVRQVELLRPKVILTLGNFAAQTLLATKLGITKLRGQVHLYYGIPLVPTYHPAALLRNEAWKRPTWEDVKLARRILDRAREG